MKNVQIMPFAVVEILDNAGNVLFQQKFQIERDAHDYFDFIETFRKKTFQGHHINCTEYKLPIKVGSFRLVAFNKYGSFMRRELFRNPTIQSNETK